MADFQRLAIPLSRVVLVSYKNGEFVTPEIPFVPFGGLGLERSLHVKPMAGAKSGCRGFKLRGRDYLGTAGLQGNYEF